MSNRTLLCLSLACFVFASATALRAAAPEDVLKPGDHDALGRGFVVFANEGGSDLA